MSDESPDDGVHAPADDEQPVGLHEQVLETVADPVCTVDEDGVFGYVNAAFERQTGLLSHQVRGEPLTRVMTSVDSQTLLETLDTIPSPSGTETVTVDITLECADGTTKPVECNLSHLDTASVDHSEAVVVMRDMTERTAREERLSRFAAVVSHDLRNPLDVALGRAEVLPEIADVDAETEQHLHEIYNSLKRMEHLIDDVLTLSQQRPDTVETEQVALAAVATEAWKTVETHDVTLTVTADIEVTAHRGRLRRLFENLFRNAIEHGGSNVEVGVIQRAGADDVSGFYVADDGPGIVEQDRDRLFEGGYTTSKGGTGLGLTIVREIANIHGWSVAVGETDTTEHPPGARFEVTGLVQ